MYEFLYSLKFLRINFFCLYQEIARDFKGHEDKSAVDGRSNEKGTESEKEYSSRFIFGMTSVCNRRRWRLLLTVH